MIVTLAGRKAVTEVGVSDATVGAGVGPGSDRQLDEFFLLRICAFSLAPKLFTSPEQPPMPEHMMLQSPMPSQCCADQLCPISCAVSPARKSMLFVYLDWDSP